MGRGGARAPAHSPPAPPAPTRCCLPHARLLPAASELGREKTEEEEEIERARSVGLHLRGRSTLRQGLVDEADPARLFYHRQLKDAALQGDFDMAEQVLEEMAREGFVPGPRAYHGLAFSHVKGGNAAGALKAIRRCWEAGLQPLSETYAAVTHAFAREGNLETAEAVYASNRRAAIDHGKAWLALATALFQAKDVEHGMQLFMQVRMQVRGQRSSAWLTPCPARRARRRGWCPTRRSTSA